MGKREREECFPVGSKVLFWVWLSIDEGDTYEGIVESIKGNYSWVRSGGTRYWVENRKMFQFVDNE